MPELDLEIDARLAGRLRSTPPRIDAFIASLRQGVEGLRTALGFMTRSGFSGNPSYSPSFRWLARRGLIIKPLLFWSTPALLTYGFFLFSALFGGMLVLYLLLGLDPVPVMALIDLGPVLWFALPGGMAGIFTALHRHHAKRIGRPRWRLH